MWSKSIRFIGRYLAIGVLVGVGVVAVEEVYWQTFGKERIDDLQQSIDNVLEATSHRRSKSMQIELARPPAVGLDLPAARSSLYLLLLTRIGPRIAMLMYSISGEIRQVGV